MPLILLDANVAPEILRVIVSKSSPHDSAWWKCVDALIHGITDAKVSVPPPVFFEMAMKDDEVFRAVESLLHTDPKPSPILEYIGTPITSTVMLDASKYVLECHKRSGKQAKGENKLGISFVDAILAGYCLRHGHWIVTENQKDFPDHFFEVVRMAVSPKKTSISERKVVYLLKPKKFESSR